MNSTFGKNIRLSVFGESHGPAIGVVIDGLPAGVMLDFDKINMHMARRAPGKSVHATPRKEEDKVQICSGIMDGGVTTGAPLCAMIENTNKRSGDYVNMTHVPRPGHSDYSAIVKYGGFADLRGGGHFSGRLTAPLVFAGSVCRQILQDRGIRIVSHIASIGGVQDVSFADRMPNDDEIKTLNTQTFPVMDSEKCALMQEHMDRVRLQNDSCGGVVECAAIGMPIGIGSHMFRSVESILSGLFFSIPAVKGVEFGAGFTTANMQGSENNDAYICDGDRVTTKTNHSGGILGGMTTGMPVIARLAFKPTPSIAKMQNSVNLQTKQPQTLEIQGRHDPCILSRAAVVAESMMAIGLLELLGD